MDLRKKTPPPSEIFSVYSVIVFWTFSWGLLLLMYNLPSWLLMVSLWEIAGYFSYGMLSFFVDTLVLLTLLVGLAFILPASWLRDDFAASGSAVASLAYIWITFIQSTLKVLILYPTETLLLSFLALLSLLLMVVAVRRVPAAHKAAVWLSSSASLFGYLYGFLAAISLLIVFIRNLV